LRDYARRVEALKIKGEETEKGLQYVDARDVEELLYDIEQEVNDVFHKIDKLRDEF
jgi:hypothetical protein